MSTSSQQPVAPITNIEIPQNFTTEIVTISLIALTYFWRKMVHKRLTQVRESLTYTLDWSYDIAGVLHIIRSKSNAARVQLFKSHNNVVHLDKSHFWKISCRHEVVALGNVELQPKCQDIAITEYIETLKLCIISGNIYYRALDQITDNPLRNFCHLNGINSLYMHAFLSDGKPLAFLMVHNPEQVNLEALAEEVNQIQAMLEEFEPPSFVKFLKKMVPS